MRLSAFYRCSGKTDLSVGALRIKASDSIDQAREQSWPFISKVVRVHVEDFAVCQSAHYDQLLNKVRKKQEVWSNKHRFRMCLD
jgi:hypothetical protein